MNVGLLLSTLVLAGMMAMLSMSGGGGGPSGILYLQAITAISGVLGER